MPKSLYPCVHCICLCSRFELIFGGLTSGVGSRLQVVPCVLRRLLHGDLHGAFGQFK